MKVRIILFLHLLVLSVTSAVSQEIPCDSRTLDKYILSISANIAKEETKSELANRANGDGLTTSRLDLVKKAFLALDLGQIEEKNDGDLVFNFNPDLLNLGLGQFTPRIVVHEPALFKPLEEQIDTLSEDVRQSRKDTLKKGIGDLDDVEARVRWTHAWGTPRAALQQIANDIYEKQDTAAFAKLADEIANSVASIKKALGKEDSHIALSEICANSEAKDLLLKLVKTVIDKGTEASTEFRKTLEKDQFFKLADLVEGQPRLSVDGSLRRRRNAAGPDERSLSLRVERGWVSYRGLKKWAAAKHGKEAAIDSTLIDEYLTAKGNRSIPRLSVNVDYIKTSDFRIILPIDATTFLKPASHKISANATGGLYLGGTRDHRLELKASYDDVTDDPQRQNRFVSTLDWVQKLNGALAQTLGGSDLVVTLIYANKPEFRGEVDRELGLRAGLKWKLGGTTNK